MATLTGTITDAGGNPYTGYLRFTLRTTPSAQASTLVSGGPVDALCDEDGEFTVELVAGPYWVQQSGARSFAIEIVDNGADYQIQNILGYDNAAIAFPYVYLFNSDTSLYHKVMVAGAGTEAGLTIDSTGTADPPLGRRLRYMVMWNSDDGMYRIVRCTGVDTSIGLQLDVAATDEIYVGTAAPTANPGYGGIPGTAKWYVNRSSGAVYVWTGTAWQAIIAEP